ncbi:hypothetical protein A2118_01735 [Candidatus Kaiserbacteria bacterium GWA2_50_9]|uniref:Methyltransferase domain-containing protein n=1 Tax=Candidatus Kaiserbacteria bacterium GWA2_50_9 TaxID=1798474 RepID=A0A1F6BVL5_9BACT|nr:MAG: hypothetical protein A2118_01735 [Candidatus Kaiserbacteria bacterium GWA2_50_9]
MRKEYPDSDAYRALYLRFHGGRDVVELTHLLEPLDSARVLDLCGGDGRLTLRALELGAHEVTIVDSTERMVPQALRHNSQVHVQVRPVEIALADMGTRNESFDRIACRQGVNYWLNKKTATLAAAVLKPGGIFAFNTFNQKPPAKPRVLQYELDGKAFVEVSWLIEDAVHHLQVREGMAPHYTTFKWLPPEYLRSILEPHFIVVETRREKTSLYRCERKEG